MKRWIPFGTGIVVLLGFGFGMWKLKQAHIKTPAETANSRKPYTIPKGTRLDFILLEPLSSGGTPSGQTVKLALLQNVGNEGDVRLPRGTPATATVGQSRGAGVFASFVRQPARLSLKNFRLKLPNGQEAELVDDESHPELALTDANTADAGSSTLDQAMTDPKKREELIQLSKGISESGNLPVDLAKYQDVSKELGLKKTNELIDRLHGKAPTLSPTDALAALDKGDTAALTGIDGLLAIQALGELSSLASSVGRKLRDSVKGHNLRAGLGLTLHLRLAQAVTLP